MNVRARPKRESCCGQALPEYAFLLGLIGIVSIAAIQTFGNDLSESFIFFANELLSLVLGA
ncbi:MAG: hypothetical protein SFZ03_03855 [Candidatus Melainabacteria bacterium]|nr:hypothetical protein [Candidatus Melainabacteria bacterium]